ncbi:MAG: flagellar hook-associated protein FlgL [Planctomycetota bacterium]|nr:flagellar hook-associated protein FlgL [Planctomycetota bacterium]
MAIRPTQGRIFDMVRLGIQTNTAKLIRAQEQASSGKRILRASDDAVGTSVSLSLRRQIGAIESFVASTSSARPEVEQASSRLQEGSGVIADIRALMIQGMNGALNAADREAIASQIELLGGQLLDIANTRSGDSYLFAGTATETQPFVEELVGGELRVVYRGNDQHQKVLTGREAEVVLNVTGREAFSRFEYTDTSFTNVTGIRSGTTADSGSGYEEIVVRQDGTVGAMGAGVALIGSGDTLVGDRVLSIDGAARTIQLGGGEPVGIPEPAPANLAVGDGNGAIVNLDLSGWTGGDLTTTLTGNASISLDGDDFTPLTYTETDLRLTDDETGAVVHVDTTQLVRSGSELVTFAGTPSIFDSIRGAVADLRSPEGTDRGAILRRLQHRLDELDRSQSDLLIGLGRLGAATQRIDVASQRLEDLEVTVDGLISNVEDADFTEVALDLQRAEQTLQLAQATGARLMQQSLLNYL